MDPIQAILLISLISLTAGHSQMTEPQSNAPMTCRRGGEPQFGVQTCDGPCDLRAEQGGYAIHGSPSNPARVYRRGQKVTIKYARNNHPPGGFFRLTMVKPDKKMDKKEHEKNAFYYSCWGANAVKAAPNELNKGPHGYSMIGSDGEQHDLPPGYYTTTITIPRVIPDGDYVMGWVWFGGTGGGEVENNGPATKEPAPYGYFSDYWSCSYCRIEGGDPLEAKHVPVFKNDMPQFSSEGCMSANDFPGVCSYEPCRVTGRYQKPRPFSGGRKPRALTPRDFGGDMPRGARSPNTGTRPPRTTRPSREAPVTTAPSSTLSEEFLVRRRSCRCIEKGTRCWKRLAGRTRNYCKSVTAADGQPSVCKEACCVHCKNRPRSRVCGTDNVKRICMV